MTHYCRATAEDVLLQTYLRPFSIQSNYARDHDQIVAALASQGLITTGTGPDQYGRVWRLTERGHRHLVQAQLLKEDS